MRSILRICRIVACSLGEISNGPAGLAQVGVQTSKMKTRRGHRRSSQSGGESRLAARQPRADKEIKLENNAYAW